jgi:hypothetical protein
MVVMIHGLEVLLMEVFGEVVVVLWWLEVVEWWRKWWFGLVRVEEVVV